MLILVDLSAAFDIIDQNLLLLQTWVELNRSDPTWRKGVILSPLEVSNLIEWL